MNITHSSNKYGNGKGQELPVSILFGTGVWIDLLPSGYGTSQEELVARRRVQRFIPAGIKAIFLAGDMMKYYNYCKGCRFDRSFTNNGKP